MEMLSARLGQRMGKRKLRDKIMPFRKEGVISIRGLSPIGGYLPSATCRENRIRHGTRASEQQE